MVYQEQNFAVGIDLGTCNSAAFIKFAGQESKCFEIDGYRTMPSVVSFGNEIKVGKLAQQDQYSATRSGSVIHLAKLLIGRTNTDILGEEKELEKRNMPTLLSNFAVPVELTEKNIPMFKVKHKNELIKRPPVDISGLVLRKIADTIRNNNHMDPNATLKAVVTVPYRFNDSQKASTKDACKIANIEPVRLIFEPTAALVTAMQEKSLRMEGAQEKSVVVFDFGGGTLDLTLATVSSDNMIEVKDSEGDTCLGGRNMTELFAKKILDLFVKDLKENQNVEVKADDAWKNTRSRKKLLQAAENTKINLNFSSSANPLEVLQLENIYEGHDAEFDVQYHEYKEATQRVVDRCMMLFDNLMYDNEKKIYIYDTIDEIVLTGGSCRNKNILQAIEDRLMKAYATKEADPAKRRALVKSKINFSVNLDESVAKGACIQASKITRLGQDPDEKDGLLLVDVTPYTYSIQTQGGIATKMIKRKSVIPAKKTDVFTTAEDNQTEVTITILEGEHDLAHKNNQSKTFHLSNIPARARGVPKIEVTYAIDASGILTVHAIELESKIEQKVTVTSESRLSPEEMNELIERAEKENKEDKIIIDLLEANSQLVATVDQCIKALKDLTAAPEEKEEYDSAMSFLEGVMNTHRVHNHATIANVPLETLKNKIKEVTEHPAVQKFMARSGAGGMPPMGGAAAPPTGGQGPTVEEAD